jgi:hypothetical protein
VPDASGFVTEKIETISEQWIGKVGGGVEQQCDAFRMFGMNGEVEGLFTFDPRRAQGQGTAFGLLPSGTVLRYCGRVSRAVWFYLPELPSQEHRSFRMGCAICVPSFGGQGVLGWGIVWPSARDSLHKIRLAGV